MRTPWITAMAMASTATMPGMLNIGWRVERRWGSEMSSTFPHIGVRAPDGNRKGAADNRS
ncbi:hypothetical protein GCM10007301_51250 [Azorhizobium oxalatiphilum]|uniref:Uncharacterized protein n=1 Tax=Azorhizobium oxalatiphilum TaxID=980631 RepID=A0A917FI93_9HYPH|nr:hypothetical protein GCM10007301_51250 [Azorhizobium oxalatiphilum]